MSSTDNVIGKNVKFGKNFKIGHFCVIQDGVEFGDDVELESFCKMVEAAGIEPAFASPTFPDLHA